MFIGGEEVRNITPGYWNDLLHRIYEITNVCVYVCVRERDREKQRKKENKS